MQEYSCSWKVPDVVIPPYMAFTQDAEGQKSSIDQRAEKTALNCRVGSRRGSVMPALQLCSFAAVSAHQSQSFAITDLGIGILKGLYFEVLDVDPLAARMYLYVWACTTVYRTLKYGVRCEGAVGVGLLSTGEKSF